jgi:ubiquinone/menaquinone biosynthesis C-methylase UbiE
MENPISQPRTPFAREGFTTDLSRRILESEEIISGIEGERYANRIDDRSLTFKLVASDVVESAGLKEDSRVLEVCCAAGQLAKELSVYVKPENITASDGGVELINAANSRYGSLGIKFEVQDVHEMNQSSDFDCVICKDSFHHFPDPVASIKELMKPLKKGGVLYIFDLCRAVKDVQVEHRESLIVNDHEAMRFLRSLNASHTPAEFLEYAKEAGVQDLEIKYPFQYSDENIKKHEKELLADKVKEFEMDTLFAVYLLRK